MILDAEVLCHAPIDLTTCELENNFEDGQGKDDDRDRRSTDNHCMEYVRKLEVSNDEPKEPPVKPTNVKIKEEDSYWQSENSSYVKYVEKSDVEFQVLINYYGYGMIYAVTGLLDYTVRKLSLSYSSRIGCPISRTFLLKRVRNI